MKNSDTQAQVVRQLTQQVAVMAATAGSVNTSLIESVDVLIPEDQDYQRIRDELQAINDLLYSAQVKLTDLAASLEYTEPAEPAEPAETESGK